MKMAACAATLLLLLPAVLLFIPEDGEGTDPAPYPYVPPDAVDGIKDDDYRGWPTDTSKVDIRFEKPVYSSWDLAGNISINTTIVNRLDRDLNLSVNAEEKYPFDFAQRGVYIYDWGRVGWGFSGIIPRLGSWNEHFNITIHRDISYPNKSVAFTARFYVYAWDNDDRMAIGANHTDIVGLSPVSVKIVSPAPSGGRFSLRTNTGYAVKVEVRNHSNETLEGILYSGYRDSHNLLLGPYSTEKVVITQRTPSGEGTERLDYYFWSNNVSSYIGFDMAGDVVSNVTAPHLDVEAIDLLRVALIQYPIELAVPAQINFSVLSMAAKTLRDQRFEVQLQGWMDEKVTHRGHFVVKELVPGNESIVPYKIVSRVGGSFKVDIVTYIDGQRYQFESELFFSSHIDIKDRIEYLNDRESYWKMYYGERISLKGYIKNLYPDTLKDITITVMMIADIGGFLSREDFMNFEPREIRVESLAPNETVAFAFNVTQDSAGSYYLAIGVFWGGNATPGGSLEANHAEVTRPSAIPALSNILPAVPVVAILPKIIDAVTRRWRKVGF